MSHDKSSQQSSAGERLVAFDFVRIVAAILVVLDHFAFSSHSVDRTELHSSLMAPVIKYAFVTVDVFFIISGYVIMMTAIGRNWRAFAVARVSRLLPPLAVCATITFIGCLILAPYSYRSIGVVDWLGNVHGQWNAPALSTLTWEGRPTGVRLYRVDLPPRRLVALLPSQYRRQEPYATALDELAAAAADFRLPPILEPPPFLAAPSGRA